MQDYDIERIAKRVASTFADAFGSALKPAIVEAAKISAEAQVKAAQIKADGLAKYIDSVDDAEAAAAGMDAADRTTDRSNEKE